MKIFDCFMFSDEKMLLDIRLNILNDYVDEFIIVESKYKHNADLKDKVFDLSLYPKFKDKIKYIYLNNEPNVGCVEMARVPPISVSPNRDIQIL